MRVFCTRRNCSDVEVFREIMPSEAIIPIALILFGGQSWVLKMSNAALREIAIGMKIRDGSGVLVWFLSAVLMSCRDACDGD